MACRMVSRVWLHAAARPSCQQTCLCMPQIKHCRFLLTCLCQHLT